MTDDGEERPDTTDTSTGGSDQPSHAINELQDGFEFLDVDTGSRAEGVVTVTIDRPEARNALNEQLRDELKSAFAAIDSDDAVRAVVLTGTDAVQTFVAGADVTELRDRSAVDQRAVSTLPRVYEAVAGCRSPVIARVNGHAIGGGCELAQACDIRVATSDAKFGQPEVSLGLIPGGGATQRLPRLVGLGHAMRLILSGDLIDAEEAERIGLVELVTTGDELDETVNDLAASIASHSPLAVRRAKRALRGAQERSLRSGLLYERELFAGLFDTHDMNEGIDAFLDDRDPQWKGR